MDDRRPSTMTARSFVDRPGCLLALLIVGWMPGAMADEADGEIAVPVDPAAIIDQHLYTDSVNACGPTAIANSLRFGTPPMVATWNGFVGGDDTTRLRFAIDRWFLNRTSTIYPPNKRLSYDGVVEEDLAAGYNELLESVGLAPLNAGFLDRRIGEKSPAFLKRVHELISDSLEDGVPPVLSLKTYVARRIERMDNQIAWEPAAHHCVAVTGISRTLRPADLGFGIDLIDPNGGHQTRAFVYAENLLNFRALKGTQDKGDWLEGRPFLLVQAPGVLSLRPEKAEWPDRVIVVANFLIGKY